VNVGFVGLGNIGLPMARNIADAGFALTVFDLNAVPLQHMAAHGAQVAASLAELGRACDCVGICVRDDTEVEQVLLGDAGIFGRARPGTVVAVHSTIRPRTVVRLAEIGAASGVHVLDVPITGGAHGAAARTLCYMAAGDTQVIERCRAVFATSAARIVLTGPLGSGMATKLANNLMMYLGFVAAFEATRFAAHAGIAEEILTAVTQANGVMTPPMLAYLGLLKTISRHQERLALQPQLEKFTDLAEKDLAITLEYAAELGVTLPATALCQQLMARVYGLDEGRQPGRAAE